MKLDPGDVKRIGPSGAINQLSVNTLEMTEVRARSRSVKLDPEGVRRIGPSGVRSVKAAFRSSLGFS